MIYDLLAPFYDAVNAEIDYSRWADFIDDVVTRECKERPSLALDLGCGTGKMTLELASRGYDMTGIDYSPEMLDIAREREQRSAVRTCSGCARICVSSSCTALSISQSARSTV